MIEGWATLAIYSGSGISYSEAKNMTAEEIVIAQKVLTEYVKQKAKAAGAKVEENLIG